MVPTNQGLALICGWYCWQRPKGSMVLVSGLIAEAAQERPVMLEKKPQNSSTWITMACCLINYWILVSLWFLRFRLFQYFRLYKFMVDHGGWVTSGSGSGPAILHSSWKRPSQYQSQCLYADRVSYPSYGSVGSVWTKHTLQFRRRVVGNKWQWADSGLRTLWGFFSYSLGTLQVLLAVQLTKGSAFEKEQWACWWCQRQSFGMFRV